VSNTRVDPPIIMLTTMNGDLCISMLVKTQNMYIWSNERVYRY